MQSTTLGLVIKHLYSLNDHTNLSVTASESKSTTNSFPIDNDLRPLRELDGVCRFCSCA